MHAKNSSELKIGASVDLAVGKFKAGGWQALSVTTPLRLVVFEFLIYVHYFVKL